MSRATTLLVTILGCLAWTGAAQAQVVLEGPPRSASQPSADGDRTQQTLTLTVNTLGGYEINANTVTDDSDVGLYRDGYSGIATAALSFQRMRRTRSVEASAETDMTFVSSGARPLIGTTASFGANTDLGRWLTARGSVLVRNSPSFTMATLAPLIDQINVDAMPDNPANAVRELRSIGTDAAVTLAGQWSPRHRTNIEYGFGNRLFESGSGLDSFNHSVSLGHSWNLTSSSAVRLTYREGRLETESALPSIAEAIERERIRSKSMELGVDHRRRVSRTRNINLSAGLGTATMRSETIEDGVLENRSPSGFVSVQFDLARSWAVSADFRRGGTVLEGISGHAFMRNFVTFSAGGRIHRKIQLTFTGDQSTGDATELGGMGSFQMRSGTSQMSYALSNNSSLLVSYTYFQHRLTQFQDLIVGFPPEYGRQAIRIGFSFNVPLVEARPSTGRRQ